jgi:HK97 gp10 family phage protein
MAKTKDVTETPVETTDLAPVNEPTRYAVDVESRPAPEYRIATRDLFAFGVRAQVRVAGRRTPRVSSLRFDDRAIRDLQTQPGVRAAIQAAGDEIAAQARRTAPRGTEAHSHAADSIQARPATGRDGRPEVRIGWDAEHAYLFHLEFGTSRITPRPFLRPAAQRHQ